MVYNIKGDTIISKGRFLLNSFDINTLPRGASVYFMGIGGISMSGLAEILMARGYKIYGSDLCYSTLVKRLESLGAKIKIGQRKENIDRLYDLIVYTAAVKPDNEEFIAATKSGAPVIDRATLLGAVMKLYEYSVAVAGTHGKTTTTSMLTHIMLACDCDPTVSIGGELAAIDGNIRIGKSEYFVCEACEYCQSFLKLSPYISVILNIEEDHLDYFRDIDHIVESFRGFARLPSQNGAAVANFDDKNVRRAVRDANCRVLSCSLRERNADYFADNFLFNAMGFGEFDVYEYGRPLGRVKLSVAGAHNMANAVCAIAAARYLGLPFACIAKGLLSYTGVNRRFQKKGEKNGVLVIDDYAHHPTEIRASLKTARGMNVKNIYCVFQPHTYTRTKTLYPDFISALSCGVKPILIDIYAAREKDTGLVSSRQLACDIDGAVYIDSFKKCVEYLKQNAKQGDLIITMGAGDVYKIGDMFLEV